MQKRRSLFDISKERLLNKKFVVVMVIATVVAGGFATWLGAIEKTAGIVRSFFSSSDTSISDRVERCRIIARRLSQSDIVMDPRRVRFNQVVAGCKLQIDLLASHNRSDLPWRDRSEFLDKAVQAATVTKLHLSGHVTDVREIASMTEEILGHLHKIADGQETTKSQAASVNALINRYEQLHHYLQTILRIDSTPINFPYPEDARAFKDGYCQFYQLPQHVLDVMEDFRER